MNNALFESGCVGSFVICRAIIIFLFKLVSSSFFFYVIWLQQLLVTTIKFPCQCCAAAILHLKQKTCLRSLVSARLPGLVQILF